MKIGDDSLHDTVDKLMTELATLYVIRKDSLFKKIFEIESHTNDSTYDNSAIGGGKSARGAGENRYISCLTVAKNSIAQ